MTEHYFTDAPSSELHEREISVPLAGQHYRVITAGGVFSPEHLDQGTEALLRTLDREDSEQRVNESVSPEAETEAPVRRPQILDLGCGWGAIALSAALLNPNADVWAVDINERARRLTAQNAQRLGLTNIRACAPHEVPYDTQFDEIRSNPPIRVGKDALHEILLTWISRLSAGGSATLVVAKHLGAPSLQRWLSETFADCEVERLAREKGFHIIRVTRLQL